MNKPKRYLKTNSKPKVSRNFSGECSLSQLPDNTYFKLVKSDGTLSKAVYYKEKGAWNKYSRRYDICKSDDVYCSGRSMKGTTKVSTRFIY